MDLIYMEGTSYSNGLVYAILQNASGKWVIYGINMSGAGFVQTEYIRQFERTRF
ncbi:MAG: hypothetical protein V8R91_02320 [Butyricimonas faecihominis]